MLAIDVITSTDEVVGAVAARPWPAGTVARVLTAIEYAAIPERVWRDADGQIEPVRKAMMGRAEDVTGLAVEQLQQSGLAAEAVIKIDDPRFVIVSEAERWPADLIFIRAHRYTELTRWLLGSVANAVLREVRCSVEIVRTTLNEIRQPARAGMKILFATDGSQFSRLAAQSIARRPWPPGTQVKVLSVIEPFIRLITRANASLDQDEDEVERSRAAIEEAEEIISQAGLKMSSEVTNGDPKEEITEIAREWSTELIVVGSHGRRGFKRLLLGSVSEAVARHAPCSVEVIRKGY